MRAILRSGPLPTSRDLSSCHLFTAVFCLRPTGRRGCFKRFEGFFGQRLEYSNVTVCWHWRICVSIRVMSLVFAHAMCVILGTEKPTRRISVHHISSPKKSKYHNGNRIFVFFGGRKGDLFFFSAHPIWACV